MTDVAGEHEGWWAKLLSDYGSIELENKGSVARDHLALGPYDSCWHRTRNTNVYQERTFLAWLRTSLAFASIGIAITQLFVHYLLNTHPSNSHIHIDFV
jgi:hypothetical protein